MKRILLSCSSGMSTSLLVSRMQEEAKVRGVETEIWAVGQEQAASELKKANILLLGPQMRFMKKKLQKDADAAGVLLDVIDPMSYGRVDGKAVFQKAMDLINE